MSAISELVVASIARALHAAQIPCVLWGHPLLIVHGVPTIISSIDFVVPDDCLRLADTALSQLQNLAPCLDGDACPKSPGQRYTPPPAFHMHIKATEVAVGIYPQSETLWFLPPIDASLLHPTKLGLPSHFALASDRTVFPPWRPGRGAGVFESAQDPVIAPRSHVLLEAFLRLYARDVGKRAGSFGMAMIAYVEEYVDDDGLLDASLLPEPLGAFYAELRVGDKPVRQWTKELMGALGMPDEDSDGDLY